MNIRRIIVHNPRIVYENYPEFIETCRVFAIFTGGEDVKYQDTMVYCGCGIFFAVPTWQVLAGERVPCPRCGSIGESAIVRIPDMAIRAYPRPYLPGLTHYLN